MRFTPPAQQALSMGLLAALVACGGDKAADSSASDAATERPAAAAAPANPPPVAVAVAANAEGEAIYAANCIACHQANGAGMPGAFPPLAGSEWLNGSVDRPIAIVLHGLQGPITVAGVTYNGVMMANGASGPMSDDAVASVLTYARASWGNAGSAVTSADVARVRAATASRTVAWTSDELKALP